MFRKQQTFAILGTILVGSVTLVATSANAGHHVLDHSKVPPQNAAQSAPSDMQSMAQMQQQMFQMHELMHRVQTEQDPTQRQKLQQEHLRLMQEHMQGMMPMMMSMMRGGTMGPGMQGGMGNREGMGDRHRPAAASPKK